MVSSAGEATGGKDTGLKSSMISGYTNIQASVLCASLQAKTEQLKFQERWLISFFLNILKVTRPGAKTAQKRREI